MKVPDIANGTLYFGTSASNSWATEIQSIIFTGWDRFENPAYLGHECRRENTPKIGGPLQDEDPIIKTDSPGEFIPMVRGEFFYEIPTIDTVVPEALFTPLNPTRVGNSFFIFPQQADGWTAEAVCPWAEAQSIAFDDLLASLNARKVNLRSLFIRFRWEMEGTRHELFAPCRYLNFANETFSEDIAPYLQPISGYVLFPFQGSYLAGYLVARCSEEGCIKAEFVTPRFLPVARQMLMPRAADQLSALAKKVNELMPAYTKLYNAVMPLSGQIDFFKLAA